MSKKREHNKTTKLEEFEISKIIEFVDKKNCLLLSSGIVQLFISNENDKWSKYGTGLVCLIKNYTDKKYSIYLMDLKPNILWEEDVNIEIDYKKLTEHFHHFLGSRGFVGLNFSFDDEANRFYKGIKKTILKLNKTFIQNPENNSYSLTLKVPSINATSPLENIQTNIEDTSTNTGVRSFHSYSFFGIKKKAEKKKINKFSIGNPIQNSFVHLNHIGLSGDNSFDIKMHEKNDKISSMIMDVLQQLNIKPTKHSLNYAKNFIECNGGFQEYYKEYKMKKKASIEGCENLESSSISAKLSPINISTKDEVKSENIVLTPSSSLKIPSRPPPKPPAPKRNLLDPNTKFESTFISSPNSETNLSFISPIPNLNQSDVSNSKLNGTASFSISPPPVPPPPIPIAQKHNQAAPPSLPETLPSSGLSSSELNVSNSSNISCSSAENRSALLKSIENFKGGLKHVDPNMSKSSFGEIPNNKSDNNNNHTNDKNDLFNQLFKALNDMRQYLSSSSAESSDSDDSFEK